MNSFSLITLFIALLSPRAEAIIIVEPTTKAVKKIPKSIQRIIIRHETIYSKVQTNKITLGEELKVLDVTDTHVITEKGALRIDDWQFIPIKTHKPKIAKTKTPTSKDSLTTAKITQESSQLTQNKINKDLVLGHLLYSESNCTLCHAEHTSFRSDPAFLENITKIPPEKDLKKIFTKGHKNGLPLGKYVTRQRDFRKKFKHLSKKEKEKKALDLIYLFIKSFSITEVPEEQLFFE